MKDKIGYVQCACLGCDERGDNIIGEPGDLCDDCAEAGCEPGSTDCKARDFEPDIYRKEN